MNYRSIADLSNTIRKNIHEIPRDVDLIVGVPRSGMLAANILALNLNLRFCDINSFVNDVALIQGRTRQSRHPLLEYPSQAKHALIVDDSIYSGMSLDFVKSKIEEKSLVKKVTYCAIYAAPLSAKLVDIYLELVKLPRLFEWNLMHRPFLSECCVDIDGVLCVDPTDEQNDDGPAYIEFIESAQPLAIPSYPVGHLVTSRLEKYRSETERWLAEHGIEYQKLHMLDLPDAKTRRQLGCHASFKAGIYRKLRDTSLFIESEPVQAIQIANSSGKPALSFSTQQFYESNVSYAYVAHKSRRLLHRLVAKLVRMSKRLLNYA